MQGSIFGPSGLYSPLYSTSEGRALYSDLQVYIQHYIQTTNVELHIRLFRSKLSTIFNIQMQSSIFGPRGLYSELYSNSEFRDIHLALQVHIQHYIQHPNVQLYIRYSRYILSTIRLYRSRCSTIYNILIGLCKSIFSTIFNIRKKSSIFGPPCLY